MNEQTSPDRPALRFALERGCPLWQPVFATDAASTAAVATPPASAAARAAAVLRPASAKKETSD